MREILAWVLLGLSLATLIFVVYGGEDTPDLSPRITELEGEKEAEKKKAHAAEKRANDLDAALILARKNLEEARERVDLTPRPKPRPKPKPVQSPKPDDTLPPSWAQIELENRALLIRSLDENLELERKQNEQLKIALDGYKSALVTSERQIECLKIAHSAHVAALKKARWKGRLEGFAIGVGVGYLGGKLP